MGHLYSLSKIWSLSNFGYHLLAGAAAKLGIEPELILDGVAYYEQASVNRILDAVRDDLSAPIALPPAPVAFTPSPDLIRASAPDGDLIVAGGAVTIEAAAGGERRPRVDLAVYSGGAIAVGSHGLIALALDGMELGTIPLLGDHRNELAATLGTVHPKVQDNKLIASGSLASSSELAQRVIALARDGVTISCSLGAELVEKKYIGRGESAVVNGRTIEGPFTLIARSKLREISLVTVGADPTSTAAITSARKNEQNMDEAQRIAAIGKILAQHPDLLQRGIAAGWDVETATAAAQQCELSTLRAGRPRITPAGMGGGFGDAKPAALISAALAIHAGRPDLAEKVHGAQVAQRATDLRCHSLIDICAAALTAEGIDVPHNRDHLIRAAFSSSSLSVALSNLAEKSAAESFKETPSVWQKIARRRNVSTFHEHKVVRMFLGGNYEELAPDGEIPHGHLTEATAGVTAVTKGQMIVITRKDIVNDSLGLMMDLAAGLGRAGARSLNDGFAKCLLDNANSFFLESAGTLIVGAGTALGVDSLTAAISNMSSRVDEHGRNVDVRARTLLVPPALETRARAILTSSTLARWVDEDVDSQPQGNPLLSTLELVVEPRLANTAFHASASPAAWYVFSSVADGPVNIALLGDRAEPTIEEVDLPGNILGRGYRGYIDAGYALGERLAAFKSAGQ